MKFFATILLHLRLVHPRHQLLLCPSLQLALQSKHNLLAQRKENLCETHARRQMAKAIATTLPQHFPLKQHRPPFPLELLLFWPSSRRQRHPLSLLPNYRAFNFNFDVARGTPQCSCMCECVLGTYTHTTLTHMQTSNRA